MKSKFSKIFINDGLALETAQKRYKSRRDAFAKQIGHLILITGASHNPLQNYHWAIFHIPILQEPFFLYLTGINQPDIALLLDPKNQTEILFLPPFNSKREFWEGAHLGADTAGSIQVAKEITGITEISPISQLHSTLYQKLSVDSTEKLGLIWHDYSINGISKIQKDANWDLMRRMKRFFKNKNLATDRLVNLVESHWKFRLPLDDVDQKNIRTAAQKTTNAFLNLLPYITQFRTETEVSGFLNGQLQSQSSFGHSFSTTVASGENATVLHYNKNDDDLIPGELILLDFGIRWNNMNSDISRTIPVNGIWNPMQKILYEIVLDAQKEIESLAKPGVSIDTLNRHVWAFIHQTLDSRFIQKGGIAKLKFDDYPHFVSHLMGYQVHDGDPFRIYRHHPLQVGWVISNEPGLYGWFEIQLDGVLYQEWIGIRIEDDLFITESGCENLTRDCPKEISDLEKRLCLRDGSIDQLPD